MGDIILQKKLAIDINDTDGTLRQKLAELSGELAIELIQLFRTNQIISTPQNKEVGSFYSKRTHKDALIKYDKYMIEVHNRIRGTNPYLGAYTTINGKELRIFNSRMEKMDGVRNRKDVCRKIMKKTDDLWIVRTLDGFIMVKVNTDVIDRGVPLEEIKLGD